MDAESTIMGQILAKVTEEKEVYETATQNTAQLQQNTYNLYVAVCIAQIAVCLSAIVVLMGVWHKLQTGKLLIDERQAGEKQAGEKQLQV